MTTPKPSKTPRKTVKKTAETKISAEGTSAEAVKAAEETKKKRTVTARKTKAKTAESGESSAVAAKRKPSVRRKKTDAEKAPAAAAEVKQHEEAKAEVKPVQPTAPAHPAHAPAEHPVHAHKHEPVTTQHAPAVAPKPAPAPAQPVTPPAAKPVFKPSSFVPTLANAEQAQAAPVRQAPAPIVHTAPVAAPKPVPAPAPVPQQPAPAAIAPQQPKPAPAPVVAPKPPKPVIKITGQPTVRELAEKMGVKLNDFIKKLMGMGVYATINQRIESELAELVAGELGFQLEVLPMYAEQELVKQAKDTENHPELLKPRPPVVTIMGHVDHGKTSLLDAIRKSNICSLESGAITQHIGAYKVTCGKGDIVFLDTPGHAAFTAMRSRGAQVTDIVILVVSATDGVMPQTIEAIDHAKAAGAPIIVAVNKVDLPEANPAKIRQELANHGLMPEEWQGKTIYVDISAKKGTNIDKLLDMIALQSELLELKANPDKPGVATVLEAKRDSRRGVVATILVKSGTVRVGDPFIVGSTFGKVRAMIDEHGGRLHELKPSMPAEIMGFAGEPPHVGDLFHIVESEREARQIADQRQRAEREASLAHQKHVTLLGLHSQLASRKIKTLQVILKADVQGSIQAIRDSLERLGNEEVEIKIIHSGAGNVNESDILLAKASDAIVFAFRVQIETKAQEEADRAGIEIRSYDVIYSLFDQVTAAMEGLLEPDIIEVVTGRVEVRQLFKLSSGDIAGSIVADGKIIRGTDARVIRGKEIVQRGKISGLKRFKEDVKEVEKGFECGVLMDGYRDIRPGDVIEPFEKKTVLRRMEAHK